MTVRTRIRLLPLVAIAALASLLAACSSTTVTATQASASRPGAGVAAVSADYRKWLQGTSTEPPTTGSPAAATGEKIYIISCGQSNSSCARGVKGAQDAATAIGWQSSVYDTQGDLTAAGAGIRQAIAAKADGIFIYFIDCSYMQQPLREAKAAGIPVVQAEGIDCNVADPKAQSLFTWSVSYNEGPLLTWIQDFGAAIGAYLVTKTNGHGDVLFVADNAAIGTQSVVKGYERELAKCPDCTSQTVEYSFDQLTNGVSQQMQQKILQNPDVDAVGVAYDGILLSGVSEAIRMTSGGGRTLLLTTGEGSAPSIEMLHQGFVSAGSGLDNEWEGWSGVDSLNRIMQGVAPVGSGIGIQLFDATHNAPASGAYVSSIDYRSAYKSAWRR